MPRFVVNSEGARTDVILTLAEYQKLLDRMKAVETTTPVATPSKPQPIVAAAQSLPIPAKSANAPHDPEQEVFTYTMPRKGASARACFRNPKMVVLKGSKAALSATQSMPWRYERV